MLSKSFSQMVKCRWREFRREPSAFFWVIFMPIMWMVVLGLAFSNPRPDKHFVGWNTKQNQSKLADSIKEAMKSSPQITIHEGTENELGTWIQRGDIVLIVSTTDHIIYEFDPTYPEAKRAQVFVDDLLQRSQGRKDVLTSEDKAITSVGHRYVDFLIPGLLGLSIMTSSLFGVGMTIVSNRKENLLKRYLATPMKKYEFLVSHIVGRFMVLAAEFAAVIIAGMLIFKFRIFGNFFSFALVAILGAACFTALALLCGSRTRSIPMMGGLVNLISLPMMMLGGVFFSKNNFPDWMQSFVKVLPLTALNDALRRIASEGQSLPSVAPEMMILFAYTLAAIVLSRLLFKWF